MSWSTERDDPGDSPRSELVENMEALRSLPIFAGIPFEIIKLHAYTAERWRVPAGSPIFRQGTPAERAYLILSGRVRLAAERGGRTVELQRLETGGFFGYMSLLAQYEWPIGAEATTDAELLLLDRESFRRILTRFPEQCLRIVERLVQMRIRRMQRHLDVLLDTISVSDHAAAIRAMES
jgi:CRP/FNR family transcriptional regulator, cyclic AMP receptor protein